MNSAATNISIRFSILTPKEVFELMKAEGYKVDYRRLPVTDEQAPIPQTYSMIESRVHTALKHNAALAFNCQMGRGRTSKHSSL